MSEKCQKDKELLKEMGRGSQQAFDKLFDKYWWLLFNTVNAYLKDGDLSASIVHDIFVSIWERKDRLQVQSFKNYLLAAARYHCYRQIRKTESEIVHYQDGLETFTANASRNQGEEYMISFELNERVRGTMERLPKRCRQIYAMSRNEQLSNNEIAQLLNISKRTVENQLTNALKHLKIALKDLLAG